MNSLKFVTFKSLQNEKLDHKIMVQLYSLMVFRIFVFVGARTSLRKESFDDMNNIFLNTLQFPLLGSWVHVNCCFCLWRVTKKYSKDLKLATNR